MKYLKKFENHASYEDVRQNLILPNVSLCEQENEVHYNPLPSTPMIDGHEYVDLGLPSGTKWATMNVGASSETDYGYYYQYGKGAAQYAATSGQSGYSGTESPLATTADTAAQEWGGSWHMPTKAQLNELIANTTYQWVRDYKGSGINGGLFTAKNGSGNYIFIPAAGYYSGSVRSRVSTYGNAWSSTPSDSRGAYYLYFRADSKSVNDYYRVYGYSVRAVVG